MGIALLPGYLTNAMFVSNLLHFRPRRPVADCNEAVTTIICARNEERSIYRTLASVAAQEYPGVLEILCVNNASEDGTEAEICRAIKELSTPDRAIHLLACPQKGKAHALNTALACVHTRYLVTVDADTLLDRRAVGRII